MPLDVHELNMLAARLAIDLPDRQELYDLADRLTSEGDGAAPLIEIMVLGKEAQYGELRPFIVQYLESRGVALPDASMALLRVAYLHAKDFVDGRISALHAVGEIAIRVHQRYDRRFTFGEFDAMLDEYEFENYRTRAVTEAQMAEACEGLVRDFEAGNYTAWMRDYSQ